MIDLLTQASELHQLSYAISKTIEDQSVKTVEADIQNN